MDIVAEFRLRDIAAGEDRAVMIVPRVNGYALRCVNYKSPFIEDPLRVDWSRHTYTLDFGPYLSVLWSPFLHEVDYLGHLYGLQSSLDY